MIEKYIQCDFAIQATLDTVSKVAAWVPEVYVPDDLAAFIEQLKPDPRFAYVHALAMTAGDKYGPNLNGDIFSEEELTGLQTQAEADKNTSQLRGICVPRYKTFETARFFRRHDNRPSSPFYGDIPIAAWNAPMRRVELIIRIAKQDIPDLGMTSGSDIIIKLDKRGYLTVSMGTRILYERCTICGNENEFVTDRCVHLRNLMNSIMPDGRQVAAENFGVRLFDLSDVDIPADELAYSLRKVASVGPTPIQNLARDPISNVPPSTWGNKLSEIEKQIPLGPTLSETTIYQPEGTAVPATDLPPKDISLLAKMAGHDLDVVLATTTLAGVVLSPSELFQVTCECQPEAKTSEVFPGPGPINLDKFSPFVYDVLSATVRARSGFTAPTHAAEWDLAEIAEQSGRSLLRLLPLPRGSASADHFREDRTSGVPSAGTSRGQPGPV
jgi:hypothetical protein